MTLSSESIIQEACSTALKSGHSRKDSDIPGEYQTLPFSTVIAFLVLGRKYQISHLRQSAVTRMMYAFPSDLKEFEIHRHSRVFEKMSTSDLLGLANHLREQELLVCLPAALFLCVHLHDIKHLSLLDSVQKSPYWQPRLSVQDLKLCISGHQELCKLTISHTLAWLRPSQKNPDYCRQASNSQFISVSVCSRVRINLYNTIFDPLPPCNPFLLWNAEWGKGFCDPCKVAMQTAHTAGRQAVWDKLPGLFELPNWDELKTKWSTVS